MGIAGTFCFRAVTAVAHPASSTGLACLVSAPERSLHRSSLYSRMVYHCGSAGTRQQFLNSCRFFRDHLFHVHLWNVLIRGFRSRTIDANANPQLCAGASRVRLGCQSRLLKCNAFQALWRRVMRQRSLVDTLWLTPGPVSRKWSWLWSMNVCTRQQC